MSTKLFKLTFYDACCSPICDGTTSWYVDDLNDFEKNWLPLQSKINLSTIERYYRSKLGEIITDYYSDNPDLNIVKTLDAKVIEEGKSNYKQKILTLENTYNFETDVEFDKLVIKQRIVKINNEYILMAKYEGIGCKRIGNIWSRWKNDFVKYTSMRFYGNPIAVYKARYINWDDIGKPDAYKDFYTNDAEFFKNDKVESFVWIPIKKVNKQYKIKKLTDKELKILLRDIVGESG